MENKTYKFHRIEPENDVDVWEDVLYERWRWIAIYNNGDILRQFDGQGLFHQFKEIDQTKLSEFRMENDEGRIFRLGFDPQKMKLIHFYRTAVLNVGTGAEAKVRFYVFGYETQNDKFLLAITPEDDLLIVDDEKKLLIGG